MEILWLLNAFCCCLQIQPLLAILANSSVYDLQKIRDIILIPSLSIWFTYLFVGKKTSTTWFQSLTSYSAFLSTLLQTVVLYPTLHSLITHTTSTHYP